MSGKFITLEGGDGVGKTTNLEVVREFLHREGKNVVVTREPGGTAIGEQIREILLKSSNLCSAGELFLLFAARAQHLQEVILPELAKGSWVVSDRFCDATYAYQGYGRGINDKSLASIEILVEGMLYPDLTLLLDAPVDVSLGRAKGRGAVDRFEAEERFFLERVRTGYLKRAELFPHRIKLVDATRPLSEVGDSIRAELKLFL